MAADRMLEGLTALLAEDNPTNVLVATEMLRLLGVEVTVASDGIEAEAMARRGAFDLLLVDIEMPGLPGGEVIRRVRSGTGPNRHAPMIALTAYAGAEERRRVGECGADGLIGKPILSIERFGEDIRAIIDARIAGGAQPSAGDGPPPALAGIEAEPILDPGALAGFATLTGAERVRLLVEQARADLGSEVEALAGGIESGDAAAVADAAHKLCGMAGAVGVRRLEAIAQRMRALEGAAPDPAGAPFLRATWAETAEALAAWKPS